MIDLVRFASEDDILALGETIQAYVAESTAGVFAAHQAELTREFEATGDSAYGTFIHRLFKPLYPVLAAAGFKISPRFPGNFAASREWGNDDETDQQRWMWVTVKRADGRPIGTLVTITYHDHTAFRIPRPPGVIALEAVAKSEVVAALEARSTDFKAAQEFRVWYAAYLKAAAGA